MLAFLVFFNVAPAVAADSNGPMAAVHQFVDGLNTNHMASAIAACAPETSIVDEFAPYTWHGVGACAKWAAAFGAFAKQSNITDASVTLGVAKHVDVVSSQAYVVVPASFAFRVQGKSSAEKGATMTFALAKTSRWHIVAWTWSKP